MLVEIQSRFDSTRLYLSACVQASPSTGFEVTELMSPINKVKKYYENILDGDFDFSFVTGHGQQLFYGSPGCAARNFLLAISQESAHSGREPKFNPRSPILRDWFADSALANALLSSDSQTIPQIAHQLGADIEATSDFAAWTYFLVQKTLSIGEINTSAVGALLQRFIANDTIFSTNLLVAINDLDPTFLGLWAHDSSYQSLRKRSALQPKNLALLSSFAPMNDLRAVRPSRERGKLKLAARGVSQTSVSTTPEVWSMVEEALSGVGPSPAPSFLPRLGTPSNVAYQVLKHFEFSLPSLEELAEVLGTQIISTELPDSILGLFVANTNAHHSAILVNRSARTEGSQRFTICHEIGHYLLHNDGAFLCGYKEIYEHQQDAEAQANAFAAELMMPTGVIRPMTEKRFSTQNIRAISKHCTCSLEAAARRFIDIAAHRQLAIIVVKDGRVLSTGASVIKPDGTRWFGRASAGVHAISLADALILQARRETRLSEYLPAAEASWLQGLEIDIFPFQDLDGYYLFVERTN